MGGREYLPLMRGTLLHVRQKIIWGRLPGFGKPMRRRTRVGLLTNLTLSVGGQVAEVKDSVAWHWSVLG